MDRLTDRVTLRYWAALREAAGTDQDEVAAGTVGAALDAARALHDDRFRVGLERCSLLVDGVRISDATTRLDPGAEVDCLPPFAGG